MKRNILGVLFCAGMTLMVFFVHISPFTTSMIDYQTAEYNLERDYIANRYLTETVELQRSHPVFSRRTIVTYAIDQIAAVPGIDIANSYVIVQFSLMFLSGILLYYLALSIMININSALLSVLGYYLSFTILFAFFTTNYTYNDLLKYTLAFASLLLVVNQKYFWSSVLYGVCIYAHESGLLLIPALYLLLEHIKPRQRLMYLAISVGLFAILLALTLGSVNGIIETSDILTSQWDQFQFNFQNRDFTIESFFSIILAIGVPSYLLWAYREGLNKEEIIWKKAYIISCLICIPTILLFARARESRLFATALIFAWPILGPCIRKFITDLIERGKKMYKTSSLKLLILFIGSLSVSGILSYLVYTQTGQWPNSNLHNEFLFLALSTIGIHFGLMRGTTLDRKNILIDNK